jgi:hypothetical protein
VARIDRHPNLTHRELGVVVVADQREVAAAEGGGEDEDERERPSQTWERDRL